MNTALPLRRAPKPDKSPSAPHIFEPPPPTRDLASLFKLRHRPGYYKAEAKTALLRRSKKPPFDELLVDFSLAEVHLALKAADFDLASGDWKWQATAAQTQLTSHGSWAEVCWHRTDDCDYLEIEMPLSHGWRIERQMLLARADRFLLLADALLGPPAAAAELHYSHSLPLATEASFAGAKETREGWLQFGARRRAGIVPPALTEWRSDFCHAQLTAAAGQLTLSQAALGRNLYAPLFIDLDPRRLQRPLTWRRLTVAENLAIVPRDIAAAYRIQAGRQQWLIYRSLAAPGNRTVIGHNTLHSFVCGRIQSSGDIEAILEIE